MKTITITDEEFEFLQQLQRDLHTQSNRGTSHPQFCVFGSKNLGKFLTACLTLRGAEAALADDGHNHPNPHIYVTSGYRNPEWIKLRAVLMGVKLEESTPTP